MSEHAGVSKESERSAELHRVLTERLDTIARRSLRLGVDLSYLVTDQNLHKIASRHDDQAIFAASVGKIPLALMALDQFDYDTKVDDDLEKMLAYSDNAAYGRLAEMLGGPYQIARFYESSWRHTSVYQAVNGRAEIGETTPAEALLQLRIILGERHDVDFRLDNTVKKSLLENQIFGHGIRRVIREDHPDIRVWNKTGEYNGDDGATYAASTPYSVRNDVGAINTLGGDETLFYAFMAKGPEGKAGGWLGDQVISLATAEALVAMGHHDYLKFGAKVMRFAGVRPSFFARAIA